MLASVCNKTITGNANVSNGKRSLVVRSAQDRLGAHLSPVGPRRVIKASTRTAASYRRNSVRVGRRASVVFASAADSEVEVVTLGEALFDLLADQMGKPRAEVESWSPFPGGAPTNVACALAQLGVRVALFSALGKDDLGDQLEELLRSRGVDLSGCPRIEHPTRGVFVERKLDGDRVFAGFAELMDTYADCFIDAKALPMEKISGASAVVTGTLGLAYPVTRATMEAFVDKAKAAGALVLVDANWRPMFWPNPDEAKPIIEAYIAKADLLKITDEEAEWLFGIDPKEALERPSLVLDKLDSAKGVLVTAGEKGAAYCIKTPGKSTAEGFVPGIEVEVEDTTGAGDAFTAGFLAYTIKAGGLDKLQENPDDMLAATKYGAATGALTCARKGAIGSQPTMDEVENMLQKI